MRHCEKCGGTLFDADECVVCTLYDLRARLAAAEKHIDLLQAMAADERTSQIVAWLRHPDRCGIYVMNKDQADAIERGDYHS